MVHETVKMALITRIIIILCPDFGRVEYRIYGKRNTIHYIGFFTQNGNYGTTGGMQPCDALEHTDLFLEEDGSFEIILSKTGREGTG